MDRPASAEVERLRLGFLVVGAWRAGLCVCVSVALSMSGLSQASALPTPADTSASASPSAAAAPSVTEKESKPAATPAKAGKARVTPAQNEVAALNAARDQNTQVAVDSLTSQVKSVVANPNGTLRARMFAQPVRKRVKGGGWLTLSSDLTHVGDVYEPKVPGNDIFVSDGTAGNGVTASEMSALASVTIPKSQLPELAAGVKRATLAARVPVGWLPGTKRKDSDPRAELMWPGKLAAPTVTKNVATYPDVEPGVDLSLSVSSRSVDPQFVITGKPSKPLILSLPYRLRGVSLFATDDGGWGMKDDTHRVIGVNPAATLTDGPGANGYPEHTTRVPFTVDGDTLSVSIPAAFINAPGVTFPLTLAGLGDPFGTVTSTYVSTSQATAAHGSLPQVQSGLFSNPNGGITKTLLAFDVSGFVGLPVQYAGVHLYQIAGSTCNQR